MSFEQTRIEGITMSEDDGPREFRFAYVNDSGGPVVITRVGTSCGCTSADYSRRPIGAGESGEIAVTFDPRGMAGKMERAVWIYTSEAAEWSGEYVGGHVRISTEPTARLVLAIEITPTGDKWAGSYRVRLGNSLRAKKGSVSFGVVEAGHTGREERIECVNIGDKPVTLSVMKGLAPKWLTLWTQPAVIGPGEVADIVVKVDGEKLNKAEKPGRVALSLVLDGLGGRPSECTLYVFCEVDQKQYKK